jgi:hypothetical protein
MTGSDRASQGNDGPSFILLYLLMFAVAACGGAFVVSVWNAPEVAAPGEVNLVSPPPCDPAHPDVQEVAEGTLVTDCVRSLFTIKVPGQTPQGLVERYFGKIDGVTYCTFPDGNTTGVPIGASETLQPGDRLGFCPA